MRIWPALYTAASDTGGDDVVPTVEQAMDRLRAFIADIDTATPQAR